MFLIFVSHGSNLQVLVHIANCKDLHIALYLFINNFFINDILLAIYWVILQKWGYLLSYLFYWEKDKSKPEVKLWFMWKNFFLKTMDYVAKYLKKTNYNINVVFYLKQIVESWKLTKTFITMKFCYG